MVSVADIREWQANNLLKKALEVQAASIWLPIACDISGPGASTH